MTKPPLPIGYRHPWLVPPTPTESLRFHLNRLKEASRGRV
jgi:hypothetical protein